MPNRRMKSEEGKQVGEKLSILMCVILLLYCYNIWWLNFSYYCLWALCFHINHTIILHVFALWKRSNFSSSWTLKKVSSLTDDKRIFSLQCIGMLHRNCYLETQSVTIISSLNVRDVCNEWTRKFAAFFMNEYNQNQLTNK